jgi:hypothetical protein
MKVLFIAGSWGSGTTSVIGALDSLGVPTLGPYFQSSDPKTRNTFELIPFRDLVHGYVDQATLKHKNNYRDRFPSALEEFQARLEKLVWPDQPANSEKLLALKMPLASLCIPEICDAFQTKIIVVHRPLEEIEASRLRRNWPPVFGSLGAQYIYNNIFNDLLKNNLSFLGISYFDFVTNTYQSLEKIIEYCDINDLKSNLEDAKEFVKAPQTPESGPI